MTDKELAKEYANKVVPVDTFGYRSLDDVHYDIEQAFLAGLKAGRPKWYKIFKSDPYCVEYWDLPQDNLPKIENFYYVKLKNGYIKICELKYDQWSRRKYFYDLHGCKQSNVAEWLDYPKE